MTKPWLSQSIDFSHLEEVIHTYHIMDTSGAKVGSMIFGWEFSDGILIIRDTSQFDNGSVYETMELLIDTILMQSKNLEIDMSFYLSSLALKLQSNNGAISGTYSIRTDSSIRERVVDSSYVYDVF